MRSNICKSLCIFVMGKNIGKNVRGKCSLGMLATCQKCLDHANKPAIDAP